MLDTQTINPIDFENWKSWEIQLKSEKIQLKSGKNTDWPSPELPLPSHFWRDLWPQGCPRRCPPRISISFPQTFSIATARKFSFNNYEIQYNVRNPVYTTTFHCCYPTAVHLFLRIRNGRSCGRSCNSHTQTLQMLPGHCQLAKATGTRTSAPSC